MRSKVLVVWPFKKNPLQKIRIKNMPWNVTIFYKKKKGEMKPVYISIYKILIMSNYIPGKDEKNR